MPRPFTLAVLLTLVSFFLALLITSKNPENSDPHIFQLFGHWQTGIWKLLTFAMQMMLMLVLGHVLALSKPFTLLIESMLGFCKNTARAALVVTLITTLVALFNWGLGLIFGAIFARKVGEYASRNQIKMNYPLVGASGYAGLMVWHGGLSGSAPLKIAEANHTFIEITGQAVSMLETVFSPMNITISLVLLIVLPLAMYWMGTRSEAEVPQLTKYDFDQEEEIAETPAERLDASPWLNYFFAAMLMVMVIFTAYTSIAGKGFNLNFINPNFINLLLFALCLFVHGNFNSFLRGVSEAIKGSAGIMIQFPLYAGIMGILAGSGLIGMFSDFFVQISNETTFPIFTLFSAGIVNFFVPSGGGQWAVQGGIVLEAAKELGVPFGKSVMALAYGDQLTNMLQPFWALPLLGITGLKARDILPYTAFLMGVGLLIFILGLLVF